MSNKLLPNTVIAGAPKSGTSSLFYWLTQHPDVCGSKVKEPYLLMDKRYKSMPNYHIEGLDYYQNYFSHYNNENILLEATPSYLYQKTAVDVLSSFDPQPHVIFLLRNPVTRIYSRFKAHKYRTGTLDKNLDLKGFIDNKCKLRPNDKLGEIERSKYSNFIKYWLEKFDKNKIHIYLFEEMMKNPVPILEEISNYLGIDSAFWKNHELVHRNESVKTKSKWLHNTGVKLTPYIPQWVQNQLLPLYMKINAGPVPKITAEEKEELSKLEEVFTSYNSELAELTGLDTSIWVKSEKAKS